MDEQEVLSVDELEKVSLFCWQQREDISLQKVREELEEIRTYCSQWTISWEDLMSTDNVGRKGDQIKFLDYGLSEDFFKEYYQEKSKGFIPYMEQGECETCREPIFAPIFGDEDPMFWFGDCTCGAFPNQYPIDDVKAWYLKEKQLNE